MLRLLIAVSTLGSVAGSACRAFGMEFEKPPIILERENTQLESLIHDMEHRLALDVQVALEKQPSPYNKILTPQVFNPPPEIRGVK